MDKILQKPIKDFMTKDVIAVKGDELLKNVFKLMEKHDIVGLPVVDEDMAVVGIVTESDLLKHFTPLSAPLGINLLGSLVYLEDMEEWTKSLKEHAAVMVKDLMQTEVIRIMETQTLAEAINLMTQHSVNRLPVVTEAGKLCGIITRKDVLHQLAQLKTL